MRTRGRYTHHRRQARENARDQSIAIGFGFASDWLSCWREFFKPITERSEAKPRFIWKPLYHNRNRSSDTVSNPCEVWTICNYFDSVVNLPSAEVACFPAVLSYEGINTAVASPTRAAVIFIHTSYNENEQTSQSCQ